MVSQDIQHVGLKVRCLKTGGVHVQCLCLKARGDRKNVQIKEI